MNHILEVLSVNISEKKGTVKKPVKHALVTDTGIMGDAHAGHWNRQVSLLGLESIQTFSENNRRKVTYGEFAENITTRGIPLSGAKPLDRFISGELILEITQIGKNCHGSTCAIFQEVGNCIMPKEGIFCRVIHPGSLQEGNLLTYIPHKFNIAVITISDRASTGVYEDKSGPVADDIMLKFFRSKDQNVHVSRQIIPDNPEIIEKKFREAVNQKTDIIVSTGGTGIGPRDYTPGVVKTMIDKEIPGIMEMIRIKYGAENPSALLSRSIAGVKGSTLIYTLPGSPAAVKEYLSEINKTLLHAIYMIHGLDLH